MQLLDGMVSTLERVGCVSAQEGVDKMEGVPLHAWSSRFFKIACGGVGRFIKMDPASERKENLEMARVLISTSIWGDINRLMDVNI